MYMASTEQRLYGYASPSAIPPAEAAMSRYHSRPYTRLITAAAIFYFSILWKAFDIGDGRPGGLARVRIPGAG